MRAVGYRVRLALATLALFLGFGGTYRMLVATSRPGTVGLSDLFVPAIALAVSAGVVAWFRARDPENVPRLSFLIAVVMAMLAGGTFVLAVISGKATAVIAVFIVPIFVAPVVFPATWLARLLALRGR